MTILQLVKKLRAAEDAAKNAADAVETAARHAIASGMALEDLGLGVRARRCISRAGVKTVEGLVGLSLEDLLANGIGVTSLCEVRERLFENGLCLRGEESYFAPKRAAK
jgi:DNA-directed RNA polymerase alpha subunit